MIRWKDCNRERDRSDWISKEGVFDEILASRGAEKVIRRESNDNIEKEHFDERHEKLVEMFPTAFIDTPSNLRGGKGVEEMQQCTLLYYGEVVFDSDIDDWRHNKLVFDGNCLKSLLLHYLSLKIQKITNVDISLNWHILHAVFIRELKVHCISL